MLYTINKSPFLSHNLERCLRCAPPGAPLLLYEDGVYAALAGSDVEGLLREALAAHPIYVLEPDLQARGLTRLIEGVEVVGYEGFVDLAAEHNVAPWL